MAVRPGAGWRGSWRGAGVGDGEGGLRLDIIGCVGAQHRDRIDLSRIGERPGQRAVVLAADDDGDREVGRIKAAGAGGYHDIAGLERVVRDVERAHVEKSVAAARWEERRVGKEWVSTCRSRVSQYM